MKRLMMPALLILAVFAAVSCENGDRFSVVCNEDYYPALQELIEGARESICVIGLSMSSHNEMVRGIAESLKEANDRGLDVRVILEGDHGGMARKNRESLDLLSGMGIAARPDSKNRVTHAKIVIADGASVLIGSTNFTWYSMKRNNESNLLILSPDAGAFFQEYFDALWEDARPSRGMSRRSKNGESLYFTDDRFMEVVGERIDNAREQIDLMLYMAKRDPYDPSRPVSKLLQKLIDAHKRGVEVRIFFEQSRPGSFNAHIDRFNKDAAGFLRDNGIRSIVFDSPDQLSHAKILIADGEAVIGSTNWYEKGITSHHQTGIATRNKDAVRGLKEYFDSLFAKGHKIDDVLPPPVPQNPDTY